MKHGISKLMAAVLAAVLTLSACSETNNNPKSRALEEEEEVTEATSRIKRTTPPQSEEEPTVETSSSGVSAETTAAVTTAAATEEPAAPIVSPTAAFNPNGQMYMKMTDGLPYLKTNSDGTDHLYFFKGSEIYKSFESKDYISTDTNYIGTTVVGCNNELWLINSEKCELIDKGNISYYPRIAKMADVVFYTKGNSLCVYDGSVSVIKEVGFMTYEGDASEYENMVIEEPEEGSDEYGMNYIQMEEKSLYESGIKLPNAYELTISPYGTAFAWVGDGSFHIGGGEGGSVRYYTGKLYAYTKGGEVKFFDTPTNEIYSITDDGEMIFALDGDTVLAGTYGTLYAFRDMSEKPIKLADVNGGGVSGISFDGSTITYVLMSYYEVGPVKTEVYVFGKNTNTPIYLSDKVVIGDGTAPTLYTPINTFYALNDLETFLSQDEFDCLSLYTRKDGQYERKELLRAENYINYGDVIISDDCNWLLYRDKENDLVRIRLDGTVEPETLAKNVHSYKTNGDFSKIYYTSSEESTNYYLYFYSAEDNSTRLLKTVGEKGHCFIKSLIGDMLQFSAKDNDSGSTDYLCENGGTPYTDDRFKRIDSVRNGVVFAKDYSDEYYISYDLKEFTPTGIYEYSRF